MLDTLLSSKLDIVRLQLEKNDQSASGFSLPIDEQIYDFLLEQKAQGRKLILLCRQSVDDVAAMVGEKNIFDQIIRGSSARDILTQLGDKYHFVGGSSTPMAIWKNAAARYVIDHSDKTASLLTQNNLPIAGQFQRPGASFKAIYKSIRAYQWMKNLLVFVPLITSWQLANGAALKDSFIMFFCFSMVASFGYIVNDILDLQSDRAHPIKKERPFASGRLSISQGAIIGLTLLVLAIIGCLFLPANADLALAAYFILTITYSLYLKTKVMIDVVALGGLFTLRVIGGGAAIETELSFYFCLLYTSPSPRD